MPKKSVAGTGADPTITFVPLIIDGQKYSMCFSFNAFAEAESTTGCNLLKGIESFENLTATQLRGLCYASLTVAHPDITLEEAGKLIRFDTIGLVAMAIGKAYMASIPEKKTETPEVAKVVAQS